MNEKNVRYVIVCKAKDLLEKVNEIEKSIHQPSTENV